MPAIAAYAATAGSGVADEAKTEQSGLFLILHPGWPRQLVVWAAKAARGFRLRFTKNTPARSPAIAFLLVPRLLARRSRPSRRRRVRRSLGEGGSTPSLPRHSCESRNPFLLSGQPGRLKNVRVAKRQEGLPKLVTKPSPSLRWFPISIFHPLISDRVPWPLVGHAYLSFKESLWRLSPPVIARSRRRRLLARRSRQRWRRRSNLYYPLLSPPPSIAE
jgi:hypothetical protein